MPLLAWIGFLWILASMSCLDRYGLAESAPGLTGLLAPDKIAHMCAYAVLTALAFRVGYGRRAPLVSAAPVFCAVLFSLLHGVAEEVHQVYVPGRMASAWDLLADGIGAAAMGLLLILWTDRPRGPSRVGLWLQALRGALPVRPRTSAGVVSARVE